MLERVVVFSGDTWGEGPAYPWLQVPNQVPPWTLKTVLASGFLSLPPSAAWLPGTAATGGVALVARDEAGKELACAPVASRVERLGATGELTLRVPSRGCVVVRLEAHGRCAFGEMRTFRQ